MPDIQDMIFKPLLGGALIGISVTLMLLWNGRVTGVSGIVNGLFTYVKGDMSWRWAFVIGLILGGLTLFALNPATFTNVSDRTLTHVAIAGFLVGFGTIMGSGCTSGHGVCGISRWSLRSMLATVTFIISGVAIVALFNLVTA